MVQTVERIMENTQRYNAQSPEDSWCGQIVQPILDLMQDLHSGSVLSVIAFVYNSCHPCVHKHRVSYNSVHG